MAAQNKKKRHKKHYLSLVDIIVAIAVICLALYFSFQPIGPENKMYPTGNIIQGAASISDGDSIRIGAERIRLLDIDAPELKQTCGIRSKKTYPCGKTSKKHLAKLIDKHEVECRWIQRDKYNRILAFCFIDKGDSLNRTMVLDGWAVSYNGFPNEEADAKKNKRGLWASDFIRPRSWRDKYMNR